MYKKKKSILKTAVFSSLLISSAATAQVYVAQGSGATSGDLVHIDVATCTLTTLGPVGFSITGMDVDSEGNLYGSESTAFNLPNARLIRINKATGAGVIVGEMTDGVDNNQSVPDISFDGQTLYGWTESGDDLITIDQFTGAQLTKVPSPQSSLGSGMDTDSTGTIYGAWAGEELSTLDPVTGVTTLAVTMTGLGAVGRANSLTFDEADNLWANVESGFSVDGEQGNLVAINKDDGTFTIVCTGLPIETDAIAFYATPASDLIHKDGFGLIPFISR